MMPWSPYTNRCLHCMMVAPDHTATCKYRKPPEAKPSKCECPARKFGDGCHSDWCPDHWSNRGNG